MLQGEIKLYEPPVTTYVTYTSRSNSYSSMSEGEKERFRKKFADALGRYKKKIEEELFNQCLSIVNLVKEKCLTWLRQRLFLLRKV